MAICCMTSNDYDVNGLHGDVNELVADIYNLQQQEVKQAEIERFCCYEPQLEKTLEDQFAFTNDDLEDVIKTYRDVVPFNKFPFKSILFSSFGKIASRLEVNFDDMKRSALNNIVVNETADLIHKAYLQFKPRLFDFVRQTEHNRLRRVDSYSQMSSAKNMEDLQSVKALLDDSEIVQQPRRLSMTEFATKTIDEDTIQHTGRVAFGSDE